MSYSFADSSTSEESNLSTFSVRGEEIYDLDSSHKNFLRFTLRERERERDKERERERKEGRRRELIGRQRVRNR